MARRTVNGTDQKISLCDVKPYLEPRGKIRGVSVCPQHAHSSILKGDRAFICSCIPAHLDRSRSRHCEDPMLPRPMIELREICPWKKWQAMWRARQHGLGSWLGRCREASMDFTLVDKSTNYHVDCWSDFGMWLLEFF